MSFTMMLMIGLAVFFLFTFIRVMRARRSVLQEMAQELGWELISRGGSPVGVQGLVDGYDLILTYEEAFMSKVFGGTTAITLTFKEPLPLEFRISKTSFVASINAQFENVVELGGGFVPGRVRIQSPDPDGARRFFGHEPLLRELRGFMEVIEDDGEVDRERITFNLPTQEYGKQAVMRWVLDTVALAQILEHRVVELKQSGQKL